MKNEDKGVRIGLLEEEDMSLGCRSCGLCRFEIYLPVCMMGYGYGYGSWRRGNKDENRDKLPLMLCIYRNLDGAGYCIMGDGVVSKETAGTFNSDTFAWLNEDHPSKKEETRRKLAVSDAVP